MELFIEKNTILYKLDLNSELDISFNINIQNVKDITVKKSSYSNSFTLPGTKLNNIVLSDVSLGIKYLCFLYDEGKEIFRGYLIIEKIIKYEKGQDYDCNIYSEVVNFIELLGDKKLRDLNFNEYTHSLSLDNVINSMDNICVVNNTTKQLQKGYGYIYTLIDKGRMIDPETNAIYLNRITLALKVFEILTKIFNDINYTFTSNFFNSDMFKSLLIPQSSFIKLDNTELEKRSFQATMQEEVPDRTQPQFYLIKTQLTGGRNNYYYPQTPQTIKYNKEIFDGSYNNYNPTYSSFVCQKNGNYRLSGTYRSKIKLRPFVWQWYPNGSRYYSNEGGTIDTNQQLFKVKVSVCKYDSGDNLIGLVGDFGNEAVFDTQLNPTYSVGSWIIKEHMRDSNGSDVILEIDYDIAVEDYFEIGQQARVCIQVWNPEATYDLTLPMWYGESGFGRPWNEIFTYVYEIPAENDFRGEFISVMAEEGDPVSISAVFDDNFKQVDFIKSLQKHFNLYITENKNKINDLIIEPRDDFFSGGEEVHIDTIDMKQITYERINDLNEKVLEFNFATDLDEQSKFYDYYSVKKIKYGNKRIIGPYNKDITDVKKIELGFSNAVLGNLDSNPNYAIVTQRYTYNSDWTLNDFISYKPCLLFYKKIASNYYLKGASETRNVRYYIYSGHLDDPNNETQDLNFDKIEFIKLNKSDITNNNSYNLYYKNEIENYLNDGKLLRAKIYLTSEQIKNLDLRNKFLFNNKVYSLNSIKNWVKGQLAEIELVEMNYFNSNFSYKSNIIPNLGLLPAGVLQSPRLAGTTTVEGTELVVKAPMRSTNTVINEGNVYNYATVYNSGASYFTDLNIINNNQIVNLTEVTGSGNLKRVRKGATIYNDYQSLVYRDMIIDSGATLDIKEYGELLLIEGDLILEGDMILEGDVNYQNINEYLPYLPLI